jgi:uncharacterized protein (UPF0297 family)
VELSNDKEQLSTTANVYKVLANKPIAVHVVGVRVVNGAPTHVTNANGAADVVEEYNTHDANEAPVP